MRMCLGMSIHVNGHGLRVYWREEIVMKERGGTMGADFQEVKNNSTPLLVSWSIGIAVIYILSVDPSPNSGHIYKPLTHSLGTLPELCVGTSYFHELRIYRYARLSRA